MPRKTIKSLEEENERLKWDVKTFKNFSIGFFFIIVLLAIILAGVGKDFNNLQSEFNDYKEHSVDYGAEFELVLQEECWNETVCKEERKLIGDCINWSSCQCPDDVTQPYTVWEKENCVEIYSVSKNCYNKTICKPTTEIKEECLENSTVILLETIEISTKNIHAKFDKPTNIYIYGNKREWIDYEVCDKSWEYCIDSMKPKCTHKRITFEIKR